MKNILLFIAVLVIAMPLMAQHEGPRHEKKQHADISELVSDLNAIQKRKVDNISKESKERVAALRKRQHTIRDSIAMYMDLEGDHSRELYPLFEREAQLQTAINREMYSAKIRIDEVLTREQRQTLRQTAQQRKHNNKQSKQ